MAINPYGLHGAPAVGGGLPGLPRRSAVPDFTEAALGKVTGIQVVQPTISPPTGSDYTFFVDIDTIDPNSTLIIPNLHLNLASGVVSPEIVDLHEDSVEIYINNGRGPIGFTLIQFDKSTKVYRHRYPIDVRSSPSIPRSVVFEGVENPAYCFAMVTPQGYRPSTDYPYSTISGRYTLVELANGDVQVDYYTYGSSSTSSIIGAFFQLVEFQRGVSE